MIPRVLAAALLLPLILTPAFGICWDIPPEPPPPPPPPRPDPPPDWSPPDTPTLTPPGTPTRPGDGAGRPLPPGTPTGGPVNGPRTGGKGGPPVGESGWSRWWYFNRSPFLLRHALAVTPCEETGGRESAGPADAWRQRAVDVLRKILEDNRVDISSGAAVALGKARARAAIPRLARMLGDRRVKRGRREAAALALGMIGGEEARQGLRAVFANERETWHCRAFAGIGLGLAGEKEALPSLLETAKLGHRELQAASLLAVGLLGDPIAEPVLLRIARDERGRTDARVRAAAVHALGRLRSRETMPALLELMKADPVEVRRAAVQALGRVAGPEDWLALRALVTAAEKDRDSAVRKYATIALGRTGSPGVVAACMRRLDGAHMEARGFAAIALGLAGRRTRDSSLRRSISDRLLTRLLTGKLAVDTEAAVAVALGLIGDRRAVKPVRELLGASWPGSRGHAAVALGLLGDRGALPDLRRAMEQEGSPWAQREIAVALGLFRDEPSIEALAARVRQGHSEHERANAAMALGRIATPTAARAMVEMLLKGALSGPTRSKVASALGDALDRKPIPTLHPLAEDFDYDLSLDTFHRLFHRL